MIRQKRLFADFRDAGWRTGLFRASLIVLVAASLVPAPVALLGAFAGWRLEHVFPLAVLAAAIGVANTVRLGRPDWRDRRNILFRLGEAALLLIIVRFAAWASTGWPTLARTAAWLWHPGTFFDGQFIAASLLTVVAWGVAVKTAGDFLELAIRPDEVAAREGLAWGDPRSEWLVARPVARSEIVDRFAQRWVWVGSFLVAIAALTRVVVRVNTGGLLKVGLSDLGLPSAVVIGLLMYFLGGLLLLSDARLAVLRGRWYNERFDAAEPVTRRWHITGAVMLAAVAACALLLPRGSLNWLAVVLEWLMALLARFVMLFGLLLQLLIQLILRLMSRLPADGEEGALGSLPTPALYEVPSQAEMTRRLPDWLPGGVLWVAVLAVGGYLVLAYLRANGRLAILSAMNAAWLARLRLWWRARRVRLDRIVEDAVTGVRGRWRARQRTVRPRAARPARPADLLPREQICYLYLQALKRAAERGLPRPPHKTPLEFFWDVEAAWPDAEPDMRLLTEAFMVARYADREIPAREAQQVEGVWLRIMRVLWRPVASDHRS